MSNMLKGQTRGMGEVDAIAHRPFVSAPFGRGAVRAGAANDRVVALTADLGKYTDLYPFRDAYPDRYFNVGMAEQALITVAAGLAKTGFTAYCTTFGTFATRRAQDFVAIACAHGNAEVKIFGGHPGITTGYGGTHQAVDDLAMLRCIPNLTIIDPCDATEMEQVAAGAHSIPGTVYSRLYRANIPVVFDPDSYRFVLGKAHRIGDGRDVGFISTGFMTERALDAAASLRASGVSASVLHVGTIKPFDAEGVAAFAADVDRLVIAENHITIGGLASLVLDAMQEAELLRPTLKIGVPDRFIECGSVPYLQDQVGLTMPRMLARVQAWLDSRAAQGRR